MEARYPQCVGIYIDLGSRVEVRGLPTYPLMQSYKPAGTATTAVKRRNIAVPETRKANGYKYSV